MNEVWHICSERSGMGLDPKGSGKSHDEICLLERSLWLQWVSSVEKGKGVSKLKARRPVIQARNDGSLNLGCGCMDGSKYI